MSEIALIMGVSRQRIHQIITGYTTLTYKSKKVLKLLDKGCAICHDDARVIHHIDHNSRNNTLKNQLPLCLKCHGKIHRGYKYNTIRRYTIYICKFCQKTFRRVYGSAYKGYYCSRKCRDRSMTLSNNNKWSMYYDFCIVCGKTDKKHESLGMCVNCYARYFYNKRKKERKLF